MSRPNTCASLGVKDWPLKLEFLAALYLCEGSAGLMDAVAADWSWTNEQLHNEARLLKDTARKWDPSCDKPSRPRGKRSMLFWKTVIQDAEIDALPTTLINLGILDFVKLFHKHDEFAKAVGVLSSMPDASIALELRAQLRDLAPVEYSSSDNSRASDDAAYAIWFYDDLNFEGPDEGVGIGRIGGSQFYTVPAAVKAWGAIVDSDHYPTYLDCIAGLRGLLDTKEWKDLVALGTADAVIALAGGGSPEKDWVLMKSLADTTKVEKLEYRIVDISPYMIHRAARLLRERLRKYSLADRFCLTWRCENILNLDERGRFNRCASWGNAIWTLLGGTLGNLNECAFFRSLSAPSKPGDILVVGVDTCEGLDLEDWAQNMVSRYESKELDELLLAPFRGVLNRNDSEPIVKARVVPKEEARMFTEISNSPTVTFTADIRGENRPAVLAHSTRYDVEALVKFAAKYSWRHLRTVAAPNNSTFRQLLLQRIE